MSVFWGGGFSPLVLFLTFAMCAAAAAVRSHKYHDKQHQSTFHTNDNLVNPATDSSNQRGASKC